MMQFYHNVYLKILHGICTFNSHYALISDLCAIFRNINPLDVYDLSLLRYLILCYNIMPGPPRVAKW